MEKEDYSENWLLSRRLWLALLGCVGFVFIYTQRVGMSVAVVCMVNQTALSLDRANGQFGISNLHTADGNISTRYSFNRNQSLSPDTCVLQSHDKEDHVDGPFTWSKTAQGHVLGSFYYGYLVSQVPAGLLAQRFGGKWVFTAFYVLSTIGTLLTPLAARMSFGVLIAMRVIVGIGSGGVFPTMHCIWGQWAPPFERSRLAGITFAGAMMGNVVAMPLSGVLCKHGFDGGWASVFYVFGMLSMVWLLMWALLVSDTPANCRQMSQKEKDYIRSSLQGQTSKQKQFKMPWLCIIKSPAVWAILVANFTTDWGLYTLLTNTPTYMFEVLKFDVQANGLFSALPFLGLGANLNISPIIADKLISSGVLSVGTTRKVFTAIGEVGAAVFLIALSFVDCSRPLVAVALLACSVTIFGSSYSGYIVNHMDIAPQYAGTLFGLTNCISAVSGFIAPYVAAVLTKNQTAGEWRTVFFITAAIYIFGAVFYAIFASGELQPWALGDDGTIGTVIETDVEKNGDKYKEILAESNNTELVEDSDGIDLDYIATEEEGEGEKQKMLHEVTLTDNMEINV